MTRVTDVAEIARRIRAAKDYGELLDVIVDQMVVITDERLQKAAQEVVYLWERPSLTNAMAFDEAIGRLRDAALAKVGE